MYLRNWSAIDSLALARQTTRGAGESGSSATDRRGCRYYLVKTRSQEEVGNFHFHYLVGDIQTVWFLIARILFQSCWDRVQRG